MQFDPAVALHEYTVLLRHSDGLIAAKSESSVVLYGLRTGRIIREFRMAGRIRHFWVSPDERLLVVAVGQEQEEELVAWNISDGGRAWSRRLDWTGRDISFSADSRRLVTRNGHHGVVVLDTRTGAIVADFSTSAVGGPRSAALSPDGSRGVLINSVEHTERFRVPPPGGRSVEGKSYLSAKRVIRYSTDGKYLFPLWVKPFAQQEPWEVRIFMTDSWGKQSKARKVGQIRYPGRIRATADGGFLLTTWADSGVEGLKYVPGEDQLKRVWHLEGRSVTRHTDFDPKRMLGVTTHPIGMTFVTDLKTGEDIVEISGPDISRHR